MAEDVLREAEEAFAVCQGSVTYYTVKVAALSALWRAATNLTSLVQLGNGKFVSVG